MSVLTAVEKFLGDFEEFERHSVNWALRSLTADTIAREGLPQLGLRCRLTLLRRLAMGRAVDKATLGLLDRVIAKSAQLQEKYAALVRIAGAHARNEGSISSGEYSSEWPIVQRLRLPTDEEINDYDNETSELKRLLETFVQQCAGNPSAILSPIPGDNHVHNSMGVPVS